MELAFNQSKGWKSRVNVCAYKPRVFLFIAICLSPYRLPRDGRGVIEVVDGALDRPDNGRADEGNNLQVYWSRSSRSRWGEKMIWGTGNMMRCWDLRKRFDIKLKAKATHIVKREKEWDLTAPMICKWEGGEKKRLKKEKTLKLAAKKYHDRGIKLCANINVSVWTNNWAGKHSLAFIQSNIVSKLFAQEEKRKNVKCWREF
jgi:hypothetical protein